MKKQEAKATHRDSMSEQSLGLLLKKAKLHNRLNLILQKNLPKQFRGITLCLVKDRKVSLMALNSAVAYRAEKQKKALLDIVKQVEGLSNTKSISCLLYTSPSPRDGLLSRMPSSA